MCGLVYALCARQVKYIILNKGGKSITFNTWHILKRKSNLTVPLTEVRTNRILFIKSIFQDTTFSIYIVILQ